METFADRDAPAPKDAGPEISEALRDAIISEMDNLNVGAEFMWAALGRHEAWQSSLDAGDDIRKRWGYRVHKTFVDAAQSRDGTPRYPKLCLLHVPPVVFLSGVELGLQRIHQIQGVGYFDQTRNYINGLFERRGVQFIIDSFGAAQWHGDAGTYQQVLAPALGALADARLAQCRREFEDALANMRTGGNTGYLRAVEEAAEAIESAMKVLLEAHKVGRPPKEQAEDLFIKLAGADIVPKYTKDSVMGAARIRNKLGGGHGGGSTPQTVSPEEAALAVRTAATAITFLATRLP